MLTKYDYEMNMAYHGQGSPPVHNMSNIPRDLPPLLSYGKDVMPLTDAIKNHDSDKLAVQSVKDYYVGADLVMGANVKHVIYDGIIAFFQTHGGRLTDGSNATVLLLMCLRLENNHSKEEERKGSLIHVIHDWKHRSEHSCVHE